MTPRAVLKDAGRRARSQLSACVAAIVLAAAAAPGPAAAQDAPADRDPAHFRHSLHEQVSCGECHGTGERHRETLVRTARDCAACHHTLPEYTCQQCHRDAEPNPSRRVDVRLELTVWEGARMRTLPFDHPRHERVACRECHGTPITLERDRECASCHREHHRPEAECAQCHRPAGPAAHDRDSHASCTTAGCHASATAGRLEPSRTLCLACHVEQVDHEPGGDCATCHQVPRMREGLARAVRAAAASQGVKGVAP